MHLASIIYIQYQDLSPLPKFDRLHIRIVLAQVYYFVQCIYIRYSIPNFPSLLYSKLKSDGRNGVYIVRTRSSSSSELVLSVWNEGKYTHFDIYQRKVC